MTGHKDKCTYDNLKQVVGDIKKINSADVQIDIQYKSLLQTAFINVLGPVLSVRGQLVTQNTSKQHVTHL